MINAWLGTGIRSTFWKFAVVLFVVSSALNAQAATRTFFDGTFNFSDYSFSTQYQTSGMSIATTQILAGGNPGSAIRTTINTTTPGFNFQAARYFFNNSFRHSPSNQGAIQTIDFSVDVRASLNGTFATLTDAGGEAFLFQFGTPGNPGSRWLKYTAPTTAALGTWLSATATGLRASDFDLIANQLTGAVNENVHPNFVDGGDIFFGSSISFSYSNFIPSSLAFDARVDNLRYTIYAITPVPELSSGLLALFGLPLIIWGARRKGE